MSSPYLLDTNILIYYFNGVLVVRPLCEAIKAGDILGCYSPISLELLCYPTLTEEQANEMREFLRELTCVSLTEAVLERAAEIRRNYRLKLPDAIIAACAWVRRCTLVTRNVADFRRIDGLSVLNPFD